MGNLHSVSKAIEHVAHRRIERRAAVGLLVQRHHGDALNGGAVALAIEQALPDDALAFVRLDQPGAGGGAAGVEHLALEVGFDATDDQAKARQAGAHDLAQVGDARTLEQFDERAIVDVAVGIEVGEPEGFGGREAVDAAIGKVERHEDQRSANSRVRWAASPGGTISRPASGFRTATPFFFRRASQSARLSTRTESSAG